VFVYHKGKLYTNLNFISIKTNRNSELPQKYEDQNYILVYRKILIKKIITINRVDEEVSKGHPKNASYTSNSTQKTWKKKKAQTLTKAYAFILSLMSNNHHLFTNIVTTI